VGGWKEGWKEGWSEAVESIIYDRIETLKRGASNTAWTLEHLLTRFPRPTTNYPSPRRFSSLPSLPQLPRSKRARPLLRKGHHDTQLLREPKRGEGTMHTAHIHGTGDQQLHQDGGWHRGLLAHRVRGEGKGGAKRQLRIDNFIGRSKTSPLSPTLFGLAPLVPYITYPRMSPSTHRFSPRLAVRETEVLPR